MFIIILDPNWNSRVTETVFDVSSPISILQHEMILGPMRIINVFFYLSQGTIGGEVLKIIGNTHACQGCACDQTCCLMFEATSVCFEHAAAGDRTKLAPRWGVSASRDKLIKHAVRSSDGRDEAFLMRTHSAREDAFAKALAPRTRRNQGPMRRSNFPSTCWRDSVYFLTAFWIRVWASTGDMSCMSQHSEWVSILPCRSHQSCRFSVSCRSKTSHPVEVHVARVLILHFLCSCCTSKRGHPHAGSRQGGQGAE